MERSGAYIHSGGSHLRIIRNKISHTIILVFVYLLIVKTSVLDGAENDFGERVDEEAERIAANARVIH